MVGSVSAPIPPSQGNINGDDTVNILDVVKWALAFGSTSANTTGNWDPAADINGDNVVNILDGIIIGVNFGSVDP
jgi:hypothetical protein